MRPGSPHGSTCVTHFAADSYIRGRRSFSEDAFVVTPTAVVVVDGASGLGDVHETDWPTDSAWFAHHAATHIAAELGSGKPVTGAVTDAMGTVRSLAPTSFLDGTHPAQFLPAAASVAIRLSNETLQLHALGDVTAVVKHKHGFDVICDPVIPALAERLLERAKEEAEEHDTTLREALPFVAEQRIADRELLNTVDGYPVLTLDGSGVDRGAVREWACADVTEILVMSDGFSALVETGLYQDYRQLLAAVNKFGLKPLADRLVTEYENDPDYEKHPRLKGIDDITAVHVRF